MAVPEDAAERHHEIADHFGKIASGVAEWDAPAPVSGWAARDVVGHLVEWIPGFLDGGGVTMRPVRVSVRDDPAAAWADHAAAVQELFADGDREFAHPMVGRHRLADAIDMFYTSDIFMHTWDLARATGQDETLDAATCAAMLAGMEPMDEMLRASGQYGPRVDVPDDADPQTRLIGFIGRDPSWSAP